MSASEKSEQNPFPRTGPYAVPDYPAPSQVADPDLGELYEPTGMGESPLFPGPFAEQARAVAQAVRGAGDRLWTAVHTHKAPAGGAALGAAGALGLAYALGRRSGRREARRGLGPVALFFERRL
ncbi:hypothetical protein [Streptomyces sp. NPDC058757]|uniref:hypothetical protein n=1 Tax=Streptomyces sp. NPDC058757 TaxID=3346626 RepID=UPI0036C2D19F